MQITSLSRVLKLGAKAALASLASYFAYYTLKVYLVRRRYAHIPGPPTKGILGFYLGNIYEFGECLKSGRIINEVFLDLYL